MSDKKLQCVIAGGGPAGLMLGVLLARAGVNVRVLEKHGDFLRDFRGDTIHPSTLEVMRELGWLEQFLELPHQKADRLALHFAGEEFPVVDFTTLKTACKYIAMMPQWDFLNFLSEKGKAYPGFELSMNTEAIDVVKRNGRIEGVIARPNDNEETILADLVVAADGRASTLREKADFKINKLGAPMDALWFRLPRKETDQDQLQGRFEDEGIVIMINRGSYWQCAFVIFKGSRDDLKNNGLEAFINTLNEILPFRDNRADALKSWDDVFFLNVRVDRLEQWWQPGLLCIGDAAHAMSPIGGVGVNLAIQDAVAAANILATPLRENQLSNHHLEQVQKRRLWPTQVTQSMQVTIQNRLIKPALTGKKLGRAPLPFRLMKRFPWLRRWPARFVGIGVQAEHVNEEIISAAG